MYLSVLDNDVLASYTSESIILLLIAVLIPYSSSLVSKLDSIICFINPRLIEVLYCGFSVASGSDAILLGAETLRGLYPVETISTVGRICAEVIFLYYSSIFP